MDPLQHIIEGCKQKDRRSQEKLYHHFYPALFALCRRYLKDPHDCLTALNNGMMNVFTHIDQYNPDKGTLFNWIYSIVRHSAIHSVKLKSSQQQFELIDEQLHHFQINPFKQLEWKEIFSWLDKLPPLTRIVCSLFYLDGYSIKEIAAEINRKEGTVKWHLNECRTRLKIISNQPLSIEKSA